jgi:uncharacterized membrane protein YidH (DUF202 family)
MRSGGTPEQPDRGLSVERTNLAWSRTGLAVFACVAAIARRTLPDLSSFAERPAVPAAALIAVLCLAAGWLWVRVFRTGHPDRDTIATERRLRATAFGTTVLGVVATLVALLPAR